VTDAEKIDRACHMLLTHADLRPLVAWWEAASLRAKLPDGPVDPHRLLMAQGDRERLLAVMERANRHAETERKKNA